MEELKQDEVDIILAGPKKSNGQIFKEKNGYTKTLKRLMNKHLTDAEGIKALRKARKKKVREHQKDKHSMKKVVRGSKKK